jgi:hypothetical protein
MRISKGLVFGVAAFFLTALPSAFASSDLISSAYSDADQIPSWGEASLEFFLNIGMPPNPDGVFKPLSYAGKDGAEFFLIALYADEILNDDISAGQDITRAQMAQVVDSLHTLAVVDSTLTINDLASADDFYPAIQRIVASDLMYIYPDGNFRPNDPVTKAEFFQILYNVTIAGFPSKENSKPDFNPPATQPPVRFKIT